MPDSKQVSELLEQGLSLYRAGKTKEAFECYRTVLISDPHHPQALAYMGALAQKMGKRGSAIDFFVKATEAAPGNHSFYLMLGLALCEERRFAEAIEAFHRCIALSGEDHKAWQGLAQAYVATGKRQDAIGCFGTAAEILERSGEKALYQAERYAAWDKQHNGMPFTPSQVTIETAGDCNRKCHYCPVSSFPPRRGKLADTIVLDLLNQLETLDYRGQLDLQYYNEPLLDDRIYHFLEVARKRVPGALLHLVTNGDLLTVATTLRLLNAGVDRIRVSVHGPKTIETVQQIAEKLTAAQRAGLQYIHFFDGTTPLTDRVNKIDVDSGKFVIQNYPSIYGCPVVGWIMIDYKGIVHLCCNDFLGEEPLGDVTKQSLLEIWQARKGMLREISAGNYQRKFCRQCAVLE